MEKVNSINSSEEEIATVCGREGGANVDSNYKEMFNIREGYGP